MGWYHRAKIKNRISESKKELKKELKKQAQDRDEIKISVLIKMIEEDKKAYEKMAKEREKMSNSA